jgi:transposase
VIRHEPENTQCACGCQLQRIGEDISEKLDYTPGVFTVEQHVRGKWACRQCETLIQAPVPAQGSADLFDRSPQASCGMLKN